MKEIETPKPVPVPSLEDFENHIKLRFKAGGALNYVETMALLKIIHDFRNSRDT